MDTTSDTKTTKIRQLNDNLRMTMGVGGKIMLTADIHALPVKDQNAIFEKIAAFSDFNTDNDPYGQHDFGSIIHNDQKVFWKIDYYDKEMVYGSEDPSDDSKTTRVLTILFSYEY